MLKTTVLEAITDAANSDSFIVERDPITVIMHAADGLAADEYGDLQISHDGATWADVYQGGSQVRMLSTNNVLELSAPGHYRIAKEATTNATGITIFSRRV